MNKIKSTLAAVAIAGLAIVAVPAAASAAPAQGATAAAARDGYLYAWTGPNRSGTRCRWSGNSTNWGTCRNHVGSVENRGYAGGYDDTNLFWGTSYTGAWACLGNGNMWLNLGAGIEHFSFGSNQPGYGQVLYNNVSSSKWDTHC